MRFVALALALAVAALLASPPAEACRAPNLVDVALTVDGATVLHDGGVVIETRDSGASQASNEFNGLTLRSGRKQLAAITEGIAPGLTVLRPPRGSRRTIKAVDGNKKVRLTLTQAKSKPPHAAPQVTRFTSTLSPIDPKAPPQEFQGSPRSTAMLTLAAAADDDVVAVVVYLVTKHGPVGAAYWRRTENLVYAYSTGGKGCVPGPTALNQGDTIALGFIDRYGRSSPLSQSIPVVPPT